MTRSRSGTSTGGTDPYVEDPDFTLYVGEAGEVLRHLPAESVHAIVTSPPYWQLRDYGDDAQLGQEKTPHEYVERLVSILREAGRVLRSDGTLWLNLDDSYISAGGQTDSTHDDRRGSYRIATRAGDSNRARTTGIPAKNLAGIPWRVALALQDDGWFLRSESIWHKPSTMPESALDRPTRAHEYVFQLTKTPRYFFDWYAVREPAVSLDPASPSYRPNSVAIAEEGRKAYDAKGNSARDYGSHRLVRSVWTMTPEPFADAHFAVMPTKVADRCVRASTSEFGVCRVCGAPWHRVVERTRITRDLLPADHPAARPQVYVGKYDEIYRENPGQAFAHAESVGWERSCGCVYPSEVPATVLDPFAGSCTTALVCRRLGRRSIGIELSADYAAIGARRTQQLSLLGEDTP